jgi:hypothetical protein
MNMKDLKSFEKSFIDDVNKSLIPSASFIGHDYFLGWDTTSLHRPIMITKFGGMNIKDVMADTDIFVKFRLLLTEKIIQNAFSSKNHHQQPSDEIFDSRKMISIHDYSGMPILFRDADVKRCVGAITEVLSKHYPEWKGKTIFLNFPSAFTMLFKAMSFAMPESTKKRIMFLNAGKDCEKLFELMKPAQVPVEYGGLLVLSPSSELSMLERGNGNLIKTTNFIENAKKLFSDQSSSSKQSLPFAQGGFIRIPAKSTEHVVLAESELWPQGTIINITVREAWANSGLFVRMNVETAKTGGDNAADGEKAENLQKIFPAAKGSKKEKIRAGITVTNVRRSTEDLKFESIRPDTPPIVSRVLRIMPFMQHVKITLEITNVNMFQSAVAVFSAKVGGSSPTAGEDVNYDEALERMKKQNVKSKKLEK